VQFASTTADDDGRAKVEFKTHDGDTLPFGATLDDLGGQAVEVHDSASAVVLAGEFPAPEAKGHAADLKGKSDLVRSAGSPFADSVGHVEAVIHPAEAGHPESSNLKIEVRGLGAHAAYTLWGVDPAVAGGALTQFASVTTDKKGKAKAKYDTAKGDALPFGATLAALGGTALEVRDASDVALLSGLFPTPLAQPHAAHLHGHADLVPPGGPVPPSPSGKIEAEFRPADGHHAEQSKLKFHMRNLVAGHSYDLWADDPSTVAADLVQFATFTVNDHGDAKVDYDTHHGDPLPFGATLADLGGQAVEVRDGATVVLAGEFPVFAAHERALHGRAILTRTAGSPSLRSFGRVEALVRPADAKHGAGSRLVIRLRLFQARATFTLWGDDPSTPDATLVQFASVTTNRRGDARLTLDTRRGDALPFGAMLDDLAGGAIEVRDASDAAVLTGAFPDLH
jgi:hypothetical protein